MRSRASWEGGKNKREMCLRGKNDRRVFALKIMCTSTHRPHTVMGGIPEAAEVLQQTSPERQLPRGPLGGPAEQGPVLCGSQSGMGS